MVVLPPKVIMPAMGARIEERNEVASPRVRHLDPVCFMEVASGTGQGEVHQDGVTAATTWSDMLDVKPRPLERLVHPTILAPARRASFHFALKLGRPGHWGLRPSR